MDDVEAASAATPVQVKFTGITLDVKTGKDQRRSAGRARASEEHQGASGGACPWPWSSAVTPRCCF